MTNSFFVCWVMNLLIRKYKKRRERSWRVVLISSRFVAVNSSFNAIILVEQKWGDDLRATDESAEIVCLDSL